TEARTRAQDEGRPYRFAVMDNSGSFRVAPDTPEFWDDASDNAAPNDPGQAALVVEGSLPSKVQFSAGETGAAPCGKWVPAVTFPPDGSAREDAEVAFPTRGAQPVVLRVRALTGAVTAALPEEANPQ